MIAPWLVPQRDMLIDALQAGRLPHAILLHGPAGTGKLALARALVARLLCLQPDRDACGHCASCRLMASGTHPDLILRQPESPGARILVDDIRELSHKMQLTPAVSTQRAALISAAEMMNEAAANALLKTLEEPSPGSWLVLVSDQLSRLPATIRSRCMALGVRPPEEAQALAWLRHACPDTEREAMQRALRLAGGAPLLARDWIGGDDLEFGEQVLRVMSATRPADVATTVAEWKGREAAAWRWLARWCVIAMKARLGVPAESADVTALARRAPDGLTGAYQAAVRGMRLTESAVRQDLLLGKWLLQWRQTAIGE